MGEQVIMSGNRYGQLPDQRTQLADFGGDSLHAVVAGAVDGGEAGLDGAHAAAELGDLPREIGGAAGQIRDLAADIGAVAQAHRHRIVEDQEGEGGKGDDGGFGDGEARQRIDHQAERRCDQHHADGDENRRNADHEACPAIAAGTLASSLIRREI